MADRGAQVGGGAAQAVAGEAGGEVEADREQHRAGTELQRGLGRRHRLKNPEAGRNRHPPPSLSQCPDARAVLPLRRSRGRFAHIEADDRLDGMIDQRLDLYQPVAAIAEQIDLRRPNEAPLPSRRKKRLRFALAAARNEACAG
jgi:hypothetical protein